MSLRIGQGWDCHALVLGRPLILGGVHIPCGFGEEAHSDGDVLIHGIIDALLGALALGDIGKYYPPSQEKWKDVDSAFLLKDTMSKIEKRGYRIINLDSTVVLQSPKLSQWIEPIKKSLANLLKIQEEQISVKAKTAEKLGPVGEGLSIEASVVVLLATENIG
ncbi:MAG: 2-C-methyl-D-erythritol 2,4-cyclodiphosphate synthase [Spirochaetaceae bacterium]|jgi:2-C-methyl-D-erythritol 2,4-cyclodiphosphate synthase|nr:2-C-methyl-D-erythritol 2,4-cyclodiphosphate synthase [Spirochaetaceae bacterium]